MEKRRAPRASTATRASAPPRKRFRIERLEERVAPKKHGGSSNSGSSGYSVSGLY